VADTAPPEIQPSSTTIICYGFVILDLMAWALVPVKYPREKKDVVKGRGMFEIVSV